MADKQEGPFDYETAHEANKKLGKTGGGRNLLSGELGSTVLSAYEETQKLTKENLQIKETAYKDSVTGLLNRGPFLDEAGKYIAQVRRKKEQDNVTEDFGVAILDVDDFSNFNNKYGHPVGDEVLRLVAEGLSNGLREGDIVGRYGGDEMAAVLTDMKESEAADIRAVIIQERVEKYVQEHLPEDLKKLGVKVTVSIGVSHSDADKDFGTLIMAADKMMYGMKDSHKKMIAKEATKTNEVKGENVNNNV